ncbi:hypothetical protein M3Y99_00563700 [Aphelenchoides fujianensis]|nr:hypothetical protein M3Y99_00563700 [Aphelenchoides fujianensis]
MSAAPKGKCGRPRRKRRMNFKEPNYSGLKATDADNVLGPYTHIPPELQAQVEQDALDFPDLAPTVPDLSGVKIEPVDTEAEGEPIAEVKAETLPAVTSAEAVVAEAKLDGYLLNERCFKCWMVVQLHTPYNLCLRCYNAMWKRATEKVDKRAFFVPRADVAGHVQREFDQVYAPIRERVASLNGGATSEALYFPQASKIKLPKAPTAVVRTLSFFGAPKRPRASHSCKAGSCNCVSKAMAGGLRH